MKQLLLFVSLFIFATNPIHCHAATSPVEIEFHANSIASVNPPKKEVGKRHKKQLKKRRPSPKNKRDSLVLPVLFWWVLTPLLIAGLFAMVFLTSFFFFWWIALGFLVIWAAVSGIVFFPIQYFSFPAGLLLIVLSLIFKSGLEFSLFLMLLSGGIALVLIAMLALGFMVLMFTMGAGKYQPKAE